MPAPKAALGRLKRRAEYLRVAARRTKAVGPGLILQAAPQERQDHESGGPKAESSEFRVGFTCSRKVGGSVERNRARRRLKAAAAELMPSLAKPGFDYVLIGRAETLRRPFKDLLQDLRAALKRLGALKPEGNSPAP
jgi:ribonuclease P protein component